MLEKIVISVVCYNNPDEIVSFAKNLEKQINKENIVLLITCNKINNTNNLVSNLKNIKIESHIYKPIENLGYLKGCIYGIKKYNNWKDADWIMISNTDILFENNHCFMDICNIKLKDNIGGIAPNIVLNSGKNQNPFLVNRPSYKKVYFWWKIQGNYVGYYFYSLLAKVKSRLMKKKFNGNDDYIYAAHGSCIIVSIKCMEKILTDAPGIFMYGEEIYVAEILKSLGKSFVYEPDIRIFHNENSTTGIVNCKKKAEWYRKSYGYLYQKFFIKDRK